MRSGTHRAARDSWLPYVTAIGAGAVIGVGGNAALGASRVRKWNVIATLPVGGRVQIPAADAFTALAAAAVAVIVLTLWLAVQMAASRKRWRDHGPTVLHGDTASRVTAEAAAGDGSEIVIRLAWVEHGVRTNERDIEMMRAHLRDLSGVLAEACENTGQQMPDLAPLEEPTTTWVPRVIQGEGGAEAS